MLFVLLVHLQGGVQAVGTPCLLLYYHSHVYSVVLPCTLRLAVGDRTPSITTLVYYYIYRHLQISTSQVRTW